MLGQRARLWVKYLKEELDTLDSERKLPVMVTSEVILKALVGKSIPSAREVYEKNLSFTSEALGRKVFTVYRHPAYALSSENNATYREFLKQQFRL